MKFEYFRYQLVPKNFGQITLFEETKTVEDIIHKKNDFFHEVIICANFKNKNEELPSKVLMNRDRIYWLQLANPKSKYYVHNFEERSIKSDPFVNILINNNPKKQIIAISRNSEAFKQSTTVAKIIEQVIKRYLDKYNLDIHIEPIFEAQKFWDIVNTKKPIEKIKFSIIKPNMADISGVLREPLKSLIKETNSHTTIMELNSSKDSTLENINRNNQDLKGLVDYSSEGGGNIKVKIKGEKRDFNTKSAIKMEPAELDFDLTTTNPDVIKHTISAILDKVS